jgi:hypothetical protein
MNVNPPGLGVLQRCGSLLLCRDSTSTATAIIQYSNLTHAGMKLHLSTLANPTFCQLRCFLGNGTCDVRLGSPGKLRLMIDAQNTILIAHITKYWSKQHPRRRFGMFANRPTGTVTKLELGADYSVPR